MPAMLPRSLHSLVERGALRRFCVVELIDHKLWSLTDELHLIPVSVTVTNNTLASVVGMPVTVKTAIMRQTFISSPSPQSSSFCTNHSSPADLATTTSHRPHLTKHAISDILNHRLDGQPLVLISWKSWAAFLKDRLRDNYAKPLPDFKNCFKSKPPPLPFLPSLLGETGQVGAQGPGRQ